MATIEAALALRQQPYMLWVENNLLQLHLPEALDDEEIDILELGDSVVLEYLHLSTQTYNLSGAEVQALAQVAAGAFRRWLEPELRLLDPDSSRVQAMDHRDVGRLYSWSCRAVRWGEAPPSEGSGTSWQRSRPVTITFDLDEKLARHAATVEVGDRAIILSDDVLALSETLGCREHLDTAGVLAAASFPGLREAAFATAEDPEVGDRWIAFEVLLRGDTAAVLDQLDAFTDSWIARVPWPQRDAVRLRYQLT